MKIHLVLHFACCMLLCGRVMAAVPEGYVVRVDSDTIYLDWGAGSGAQSGDRFQVHRNGAPLKHPVTGEMLGKTQEVMGSGTVRTVEPKFSVGHLDPFNGTPRPGDRARWWGGSILTPPPESAPAAGPETGLTPPVPVPLELWRSPALDKDAAGLAFSDLDGDGKKEIIVAYRKKIQAYRLKDKTLEPLAAFDGRTFGRWLAVEAADLKGDGQEEIFATAFQTGINRPRVVVLRFENGGFKNVGEFEGFVRAVARADGRRPLYWQTLSRALDLSFTGVSELTFEKGAYRPGRGLDLKLFNDQLFGFAWGSWYGPGEANLAVLEHGDRIRIYSPEVKWKSSDVYGGTKNDFPVTENDMGSLSPRLLPWRPDSPQAAGTAGGPHTRNGGGGVPHGGKNNKIRHEKKTELSVCLHYT